MAPAEDIAIVGYSFKLPQDVDDDCSLWDVLSKRRNLMTDCPKSRIDSESFFHGHRGHFINEDLGLFDAPFFSVTANEAAAMDPMQRWTLETTYHAFEKAGIPVESLRGSQTAVFSASMVEDYAKMIAMDPDNAERTAVTGSSVACVIPNRISWYFDLRGPSIHVNTACSSSLSAVDMACKTIHSGDATCAVVTGSNLLLDPAMFQALSAQKFLSPDGLCQSFDHKANGYGRGEGIIAIVLKPVSLAVQNGDIIRAVIRSTGSNQDGHTPGLTQPSSQAQEDLIRHVYAQAGLSLDQTRYVEAHDNPGTGTAVGDPIETKAIGRSFCQSRSAEEPLYIGSIKANIGHLEGASGLAVILERAIIPPNALLEKINPAIDVEHYNITVPTKEVAWPSSGLRRASVNSFGFGGSNTHVIIEDSFHYLRERDLPGRHCTTGGGDLESPSETTADLTNGTSMKKPVPSETKLLVWTAASEKAVKRVLEGYDAFYKQHVAGRPWKLDHLAYTLTSRRSKMLWRSFAVVSEGLEDDQTQHLATEKPIRSSADVGLAFIFTGQGAQYIDMGKGLTQYPIFHNTLKQIDDIYRKLGCGWSIFDELGRSENINKPEYSQPLSTAIQISLVELLHSFEIRPRAVIGHSSGEIAAAYAVGGLDLESACKVSYFRGQLAGHLREASASYPGAMISINIAEDHVPDYLKGALGREYVALMSVACVNSPLNCTLSGPEDVIDKIKQQADKDGIFAQKLKTGVAYHSPSVMSIASEYLSLISSLKAAGSQDPKVLAHVPMVSSVTGKPVCLEELSKGEYWVDNMVCPVRFADAVQHVVQDASRSGLGGISDLVEIGPHPALRRPTLDTIKQTENQSKDIRYTSSLHRSRPAVETVLSLVGRLFGLGHSVSVSAANQQSSDDKISFLTDCPKYPFDHSRRYWGESRISRGFRLRGTVQGETLGVRVSDWNPFEPRWRNFLSVETDSWIGDYKVGDKVLYSAAGMLVMAIEAVQQMVPGDRDVAGYHLKTAEFLGLISVQDAWEDRVETEVHLRPVDRKQAVEASLFEVAIYSYAEGDWTQRLRASIQVDYKDSPDAKQRQLNHDNVREQFTLAESASQPIDSHVFYGNAAENGLHYGDSFRLGQDIHWDGNDTAVMRVDVTKPRYRTSSLVHPAVLDQAFHVLRVSAGQQPACNVPIRLSDAWFAASGWQIGSIRWMARSCCDRLDRPHGDYGEEGSVHALADDGSVLCTIQKVTTKGQSKSTEKAERKLLHRIEWKPTLGLMDPERLRQLCGADTFSRDETAILANHAQLCSTLDLVAARTLRHLDRTKVPDSLRRHVEWIEHHVSKMSSETIQASEGITDTQVEAQLSHIEEVLPAWKVYTACARRLPEILAGEVDPLQVVFGSNLADIFYADLFQYLCADGRLGTILDLAAHENPALRILEVGAGTGGMTTHVLTALHEREKRTGGLSFAEYTYTDISPAFFERAMGRWPDLQSQGCLSFKTLDLDRDVEEQGYEPGSYDIVVAACVLHATPDLEATIRNVRKALRPGGQLILLEVINSDDIATNFMAGLLPGWWVAREEWRPHSAAVPESLWDKCLRANGFSGNDVVIRDFKNDPCHIMSVIVSTAVEVKGEVTNVVPPQGRLILIVEDQDLKQQELAKSVLAHINTNSWSDSVICGFSMDQLSGVFKESARNDTIICLYEVCNKPLLSVLAEESFACLQLLVNETPRLLWATAPDIDSPHSCQYSVAQGFLRSIRAEQTDSHMVTLTIEDNTDLSAAPELISNVFRQAYGPSASKEVEYLVRDGMVLTGRVVEDVTYNTALGSLLSPQLQSKRWADAEALQVSPQNNNFSESLQFVPDARHDTELGPHEVEIEAKAWGLNQQDIQASTTRRQSMFRCDCVGAVTRVGPDCDSSIQPGDRVFMMVDGGMRKYPRAKDPATVKLPDALSFESAALTLGPLIATVHGLVNVARIRPGESILVHSADSVVGQMAVQVAQAQGARIFATASSSRESSALATTLGISTDSLFDSRDPRWASKLFDVTAGAGVDVVFNSDSNKDTLRASCECIGSGGHLIEVASAEVENSNTEFMAEIPRNVTFSSIDLLGLKPSAMANVMRKAVELLADGKVQPSSKAATFSVSDVENAFKHLQESDKGCRAVIYAKDDDVAQTFTKECRSWKFDSDSSYLVAGGFGGLGRAIIRWMVERGAKQLIIPSRSGPSSSPATQLVDELMKKGVNLMTTSCDISSEPSLAILLEQCAKTMPPIKGCINAAMVLQDATFQTMTFTQWDLAVRTKVQTSWNLHRLLPRDLDFFVLLSSLAGVIGQMASANYAAGCSFQDALARHRAAQGQRGLSIDIGWMRNVGIVSETAAYQRQRQKANDMQQIDEGELLALLSLCCDPSAPLTTEGQLLFGLKTPADILSQGQTPPALLDRPLFRAFSHLPGSASKADKDSSSRDADHQAAALFRQSSDPTERTSIVLRALAAKLARAMSMSPEDIEPHKPLSNYGVDSLMAVELKSWIGRDFGAPVAIGDIMGGVPIASIADVVVAKSALENK
uniref:Putative polyketide synthase n=1 Tax=Fusarium euwallaceae TaxID=1147111 RepID=A0A0U2RVD5_9HYPO|nr:putative polyketide synthase [Fusarium euwallaceae]